MKSQPPPVRTTIPEALGRLFGAVVAALFLVGWVLPTAIAIWRACSE